jgi:NAD(P)-dependent dehydrogenase (short-subunit alcohol dehydrogenase family)
MPIAIVTGADSGIGKATAVKLAERGFDLGITWHSDEDGIRDTAREVESHGRRVEVRQVDLSEVDAGARVVAELADALGGIDVLVNNAGTGTQEPFLEMDLDTWKHVLAVDLTAAFRATQEAARRMIDAGTRGRIVNVTSVHEHIPLEGAAPYVAAKHGLGGFTKVAALELAEHGITVNAVAPGEIATPMTGNEDVDPNTVDRPGIPAGRPGSAHEIAAAVAFLASEDASYVTGESLVVDGGLMLMAAMANQLAND